MVKLNNVEKVYRTESIETLALHDINLDVDKGEFVSVMGPSGCGKSTLLNIMGLLDAPTKADRVLKYCFPPTMYVSLCPAPFMEKKVLGSTAASNSLFPIKKGTMSSSVPWIKSLGTETRGIFPRLL